VGLRIPWGWSGGSLRALEQKLEAPGPRTSFYNHCFL